MTSGVPVGTLIGLTGSGWLVQRYGWAMPFYVFGSVGLLWLILWFRQVENDPAGDPRLGAEERELLQAVRPATHLVERVPLRRLLLRASVAGIVAGHVAFNWSQYVLLSWLPSYFREVHGLSIAHSGLFSAAPWLSMFAVYNLAGSVADRMTQRGIDLTTTRKRMHLRRPYRVRWLPARATAGTFAYCGSDAPVRIDRCTRVGGGGIHAELSRCRSTPRRRVIWIWQYFCANSRDRRRRRYRMARRRHGHLLGSLCAYRNSEHRRCAGVRISLRCPSYRDGPARCPGIFAWLGISPEAWVPGVRAVGQWSNFPSSLVTGRGKSRSSGRRSCAEA